MLGRDYAGQNCSVARSLEVVGERWTLLILRDAFLGVRRFEGFQERLKLAPNILAKRLRTLTEAGVLERRRYRERPERFEYVLTGRGEGLLPVVLGLMRWGDAHLAPNGPPAVALHAGCGGELAVSGACELCARTLGPGEVEWHRGPGSGRPARFGRSPEGQLVRDRVHPKEPIPVVHTPADRDRDRLYLDDLRVGQRFTTGTHTLDEDEIREFARRFDPQPFHLDDEAAENGASVTRRGSRPP